MKNIDNLKVIAGPGCSPVFVERMCDRISVLANTRAFSVTGIHREQFRDGEFLVQISKNVRGADVFVVMPTIAPEDNFKCMKMLLQSAALASAESVTAVPTYLRDLRQDRKTKPRTPVTAKQSLREIEVAMAAASRKHIIFFHPHFSQVTGFVEMSSDILYPTHIFSEFIRRTIQPDPKTIVPAGADSGAATLSSIYAKLFDVDTFAVGFKVRDEKDRVRFKDIIGEVEGKVLLVFDDIIDTGGTVCQFVRKAHAKGAQEIYVFATHGIFAGEAVANLQAVAAETGCLKKVVVTNSLDNEHRQLDPALFDILDCGELVGEAIYRTYVGGSISEIAGAFAD